MTTLTFDTVGVASHRVPAPYSQTSPGWSIQIDSYGGEQWMSIQPGVYVRAAESVTGTTSPVRPRLARLRAVASELPEQENEGDLLVFVAELRDLSDARGRATSRILE